MTPEERERKREEARFQQSMAAQVMRSFTGMPGPPEFTINNYGDIIRIEDFEEMGEAVTLRLELEK